MLKLSKSGDFSYKAQVIFHTSTPYLKMSLADLLSSLGLSTYISALAVRGYTQKDQLDLPEGELDSVLASAAVLKGHAIKLKRALEQARRSEPPPCKRPRLEESQSQSAPKKPVPVPNTLAKDVERLMARLADIEQVREDIGKARSLILAVDLARYRRALDQVEFIQKTIRAVEEAEAENVDGSSL